MRHLPFLRTIYKGAGIAYQSVSSTLHFTKGCQPGTCHHADLQPVVQAMALTGFQNPAADSRTGNLTLRTATKSKFSGTE